MENKIDYIVLVAIKDYKIVGMKEATTPQQRRVLFLNPELKDQRHLETEIFKSFFGEDLGKKDFFLEAGSYKNIVDEYEKTLRILLEKEHKVPKEYYDNIDEYREVVYRNLFTIEDYVDNKHRFDEVYEVLGEYYVFRMKHPLWRIAYEFNMYYLYIKRLFDNGEPLYISTTMPFEDLGF